ncbi:MAG: hypothetical protein IJM36_04770 [Acholeplasmatales bacterium]|nr:hypothetical protein [Acholeplasmatales bacterium]
MISRSRIENYFDSIGVDEETTFEDGTFVTTFIIDYDGFQSEVVLTVDEFNIRLELFFSSVDYSDALLKDLNEFNRYSKYYKAYYSFSNEMVVLSTTQMFQNSKFEEILEKSLNSLVNLDSEYIENLFRICYRSEA